MNTFILVAYLMSFLLKPFLHVSCLVPIMMIPQCSYFDVVFSLFCHSLQFILIVTITCSTDLDDSPDTHTTCLACCVVFSRLWFSQLVCWNIVHNEKRSGRYLLFVEVSKQEWTGSISELERLLCFPQFCPYRVDRESPQYEDLEICAYREYHGHVPSSER